MQPYQILSVTAFLAFAAGARAQYLAWPQLGALEARGLIRGPVREFREAGYRPLTALRLVWATPIPADQKRLRLLLLIARLSMPLTLVLALAAAIALVHADLPEAPTDPDAPPEVNLTPPPE